MRSNMIIVNDNILLWTRVSVNNMILIVQCVLNHIHPKMSLGAF